MMVGIFGAGRNGSTLLMRVLDGSPGLWVYPLELNYFSAFGLQSVRGRMKQAIMGLPSGMIPADWVRNRYRQTFFRWARHQVEELNETYATQLVDPVTVNKDPVEGIRQGITGSARNDLIGFLRAMKAAYDDRITDSEPLLAFKSIEVGELARYRDLFPEMRFIHIVRHPYSNYESLKRTDMVLKRKPFWFQGGDILRMQLEDRWIPHVRFFLNQCRQDPGRHFVVKYEELCSSPEGVVKDICRWVGVPPPVDPGLQTVLGGKRMKQLPINPSQDGVETPERVVANMARTFRYEEVISDREKDLILARTHSLARQLGYFSPEEISRLPNRFHLLLRWLPPDRWELMNSDSTFRLATALLARRFYVGRKLLLPLR
jgi:hypothetical protein